jgi:hypothetical protein
MRRYAGCIMQTAPITNSHTEHGIDAETFYTVPRLADALDSGTRPIYEAIRLGDLKATSINDRGDLRILGAWAIAWLDRRAAQLAAELAAKAADTAAKRAARRADWTARSEARRAARQGGQ